MELIQIYRCFCDRTRLRILNLLCGGELCVCHIQEILNEPQVKISKHLNYMKTRGLVSVRRDGNRMIYALPAKQPPELARNLACLQDCAGTEKQFAADCKRLVQIQKKLTARI